jgi:NAD+ synthase (glutamine-hydrolysing)
VRIALAQLDTTVGALEENAAAVERAALAAADAGAELVVFPELTVPGYLPRDLLDLREFVARNEETLRKLAEAKVFHRIAGLVGFAQPHEGPGTGLYNAAALLQDGAVRTIAQKGLLPTYDVFDEARYFDPGAEVCVARIGTVSVGISICEDLWNDKIFWRKPRYLRDPIEELVARGAQCIVNLSASPYALGKAEHRRRVIGATARRHGVPIALCNLVGGNDSILFDGRSAVFRPDGSLAAEAKAFEEDLLIAELPSPAPEGDRSERRNAPAAPYDEKHALAVVSAYESRLDDAACDELVAALTLGIRDYAAKTGFRRAVLGISGGVDSALTAVLAARALGPAQVTGISMPSRYTASMSNDDARLLCERLGIGFLTIPIEPIFGAYLAALAPAFAGMKSDVTEENLQARIRGTLLMAHSNKTGALLLSTGNKSELGTGFCTLYGDMAGGLACIGDLPKTAVYAVADRLNRQGREIIPRRILDRPPTAELRENQTDQDTLPAYADLDRVLRGHVEEHLGAEALIARGEPEALVRRVLKLVVGSEYKRRQAAPVLRVTPRAFGEGWRFPIAQRYRY